MRSHLLLIGGRSGVGRSTAGVALHERLAAAGVRHALIEGDFLDLAHPAPHLAFPQARLAERNLRAMWSNYRELGYRRLILTNTMSVLLAAELAAAMSDEPVVTAVLLRATDSVTGARLAERAHRRAAATDLAHSASTARRLDAQVPDDVHRIDTDRLLPAQVADRLAALIGWESDPQVE